MEKTEIILSDEQIKKIALFLHLDIANYIKEHKDEYSKWLKVKEDTNE